MCHKLKWHTKRAQGSKPAILKKWRKSLLYNSILYFKKMLDLSAIREFIQEHPGCDWEDACDWFEQISGLIVPESQWGMIEEVWDEESQLWEPTDDEMMSAFGTKWHDAL